MAFWAEQPLSDVSPLPPALQQMHPWLCRHYITGSTQTRPWKVCFHGNRYVAVAGVGMTWSEVTAWLDGSTAANLQLLYTKPATAEVIAGVSNFIFLLHLLFKLHSGSNLILILEGVNCHPLIEHLDQGDCKHDTKLQWWDLILPQTICSQFPQWKVHDG